jgi:putative peptidoglycan lipid II flippase
MSPVEPSIEEQAESAVLAPPAAEGLVDDGTSQLAGLGRSAALLTIAASLGQVFGVGRELFVASRVGTSPQLDALLIALVAPTMVAGLLASGSAAALVPAHAAVEERHGRAAAQRMVGVILTWTTIAGLAFMLALTALAPVVVAIAGPGLSADGRATAEGFVPIVAPILVLSATGGLITAVFQVLGRFRPIAIAWLLGPIVSLIVTIGLWPWLGLTAYAVALVLNPATTLIVLILLAARSGDLPRPALRTGQGDLGGFVGHAVPLTISASVLQFNLLADRSIASLIASGAVSALRYGDSIVRLPLNTLGPAWARVVYPSLVAAARAGDHESVGASAYRAMRYLLAIFVPISVGIAALAPLGVRIVFGRGAFDDQAITATAAALAGFAGLVGLTMVQGVLVGAHNAQRRAIFLMLMGFLNAILNLIFDIIFGFALGIGGIALSTTLTMAFVLLIMGARLNRADPAFRGGELLGVAIRAVIASLVPAVPAALIAWSNVAGGGLLVEIAVTLGLGAIGAVEYVIVARWLRLDEPWIVARGVAALVGRRAGAGA